MAREKRTVRVGSRLLGGSNPILIQTMADVKTSHVASILRMDQDLFEIGNDLLRLSVLDEADLKAFKVLSSQAKEPLIADIHFSSAFAVKAMENGAAAIRINPGNIGRQEDISRVISAALVHKIPIRIGVNSGSLPLKYATAYEEASSYVGALKDLVAAFEAKGFYDLVLSLKSSDPEVTYQAYKLADAAFPYPLHLGVTEAGPGTLGAVRSAAALVPLLKEGIGNTIRISLTDPPREEVLAAKALLKALGLRKDVPVLISCPTCGRTQVDLAPIAAKVAKALEKVHADLKVAVMGCPVNGPGEARDADLGLAGGVNSFLVFEKGRPLREMKEKEALSFLLKEIARLASEKKERP
jgi:(E)-4-hydroxy-3-methylbut-2-enyl-diphosphate synthase